MKSDFENDDGMSFDDLLNIRSPEGFKHLRQKGQRVKECRKVKRTEVPASMLKLRPQDCLAPIGQELKIVTQSCLCCAGQVRIVGSFFTVSESEIDSTYKQLSFAAERIDSLPLTIKEDHCFVPICANCAIGSRA
jgi:hypothetical protein